VTVKKPKGGAVVVLQAVKADPRWRQARGREAPVAPPVAKVETHDDSRFEAWIWSFRQVSKDGLYGSGG
jgi:hypothetical protein